MSEIWAIWLPWLKWVCESDSYELAIILFLKWASPLLCKHFEKRTVEKSLYVPLLQGFMIFHEGQWVGKGQCKRKGLALTHPAITVQFQVLWSLSHRLMHFPLLDRGSGVLLILVTNTTGLLAVLLSLVPLARDDKAKVARRLSSLTLLSLLCNAYIGCTGAQQYDVGFVVLGECLLSHAMPDVPGIQTAGISRNNWCFASQPLGINLEDPVQWSWKCPCWSISRSRKKACNHHGDNTSGASCYIQVLQSTALHVWSTFSSFSPYSTEIC